MSSDLETLIAKKFIQRRDVKAIQFSNGDYVPDFKLKDHTRHGLGFKMSHLRAHLARRETYGHYLIDTNNKARIFCLDIDLQRTGSWVELPRQEALPFKFYNDPEAEELWYRENTLITESDDLLSAWADRKNLVARAWFKMQMKVLASRFASIITKDLKLPCAVTYTGNKGVHVYGFLGETDAKECREAALLALDLTDEWEPLRGKNFYKHKNQDPVMGYPSFSVETFPKQDSLDGKSLGNLLRLPLGVNLKKPKDPTFFLDLNGKLTDFTPHPDPAFLLESGDPFQQRSEG